MLQRVVRILILGALLSLFFCQTARADSDAEDHLRQVFRATPEAIGANLEPSTDRPKSGCAALATPGQVEMEVLNASDVAQLRDPFGERVFQPSPNQRNFSKIINQLLGRPSTATNPGYNIVVVKEWIKQSQPDLLPDDRRFAVMFDSPELRSRCMLSGTLTADGIEDELNFLEAWGWDSDINAFRYYELTDDGWSFAGTSPQLDEPSERSSENRCLQCHRTGVPVMKELRLPWNNWNSGQSPNAYLTRTSTKAWPGLTSSALADAGVGDPEALEKQIKSAIGRFNRSQISSNMSETDEGRLIANIKLLIKPLFVEREVNFASSQDNSPNSAFLPNPATPAGEIRVPGGLLLAHRLIGNGDTNFRGLGLPVAGDLDQSITMPAQTYSDLVKARQLAVQTTDPSTGVATFQSGTDTDFAFFTPVRSYADDHFVGRLLRENILTREFIASALLIDVDQPLFSAKRQAVYEMLSDLLPDEMMIPDDTLEDPREHPLTKFVVEQVASMELPADDPLTVFADLLSQDESPVDQLDRHWQAKRQALVTAGQTSDTADAQMVFADLFDQLLDRRHSILENPEFRVLDETIDTATGRSRALLPSPPLNQ